MQQVANLVLKQTDPHPAGHKVAPFVPRCEASAPQKRCFSVVYAPANVPWVHNLMQDVAHSSGLDFDKYFFGMGNATGLSSWTTDNSTMYDFFVHNQNVSQVGIIFAGPYLNPYARGQDISNELGYWLYYNQSMASQTQSTILAIEQQISNQLLKRNHSRFYKKQNEYFKTLNDGDLRSQIEQNDFLKSLESTLQQPDSGILDSETYSGNDYYDNPLPTTLPYDKLHEELMQQRETFLSQFSESSSSSSDSKSEEMQSMEDYKEASTLFSRIASGASFKFSITFKDFPATLMRIAQLSLANQSGGTLYFIPPMILFFVLLTETVAEKETKLRVGMKMMGLSNAAYWASWYTHGIMWVFLITGIQYLAGLACGYTFFTRSNAFSVLSLFWTFGIAMMTVAFFLSTLIGNSKTAQTVGYAIILVGFVFQAVLNSLNGLLVDMLWLKGAAAWIVAVRYLLSCYPPFSLAKAWSSISVLSSAIPSFTEGMIVNGPGFHWSDMYKSRLVMDNQFVYVMSPPPAESYYTLMINILFFATIAWYLDNVLPGEHGSPRPFYFPFTREYWGLRKKKKRYANATKSKKQNQSHSAINDGGSNSLRSSPIDGTEQYDSDVEAEQQIALMDDNDDFEKDENSSGRSRVSKWAVHLRNISKIYRRWSCCRSDTDTFAVDDVSVTIEKGELFTLLGHNGAGKTTLISMLTGLFKPSSGSATIYGLDLEEDAVRSVIGVCPQHDVLWPELTAREHLLLFSRVKGIPSYLIDAEVHDKLELVGLTHVANEKAGSFSGGMKRRLSVAVSCIGDPKLIFLDEPSSGLDPVNKRKIWRMIEGLKRNRAIVLTTHSMEEAEVLSDRLAIMAYGKIRAIGDSLHLKNKYGDGYRISIVVDVPIDASGASSPAVALYNAISSRWKDVNLISNDTGMLLLGCPKTFQEEMPALLDFVMADSRVKEWGLSHSTLESVFLAVTKKHNFVYDEITEDEEFSHPGDSSAHDETSIGNNGSMMAVEADNADENFEDDDADDRAPLIGKTKKSSSAAQQTHHKSKDTKSSSKQKGHTSHGRQQLKSHPMRALVRKNLTLQWRQRFSTCCQLLTPLLIILILFILKAVIKSQLGPIAAAPHVFPGLPIAQNLAANLGRHVESRSCGFFFAFSDASGLAGRLDSHGNGTGMLHHIPQYRCTFWHNETHPTPQAPNSPVFVTPSGSPKPYVTPLVKYSAYMPYFDAYKNEKEIQAKLYANLTHLNTVPIKSVRVYPNTMMVPDAYVAFGTIDDTNLNFEATVSVNTNPMRDYHRRNNFTRLSYAPKGFLKSPTNLLPRDLDFQNGFWTGMTMMTRSFTSWALSRAGIDTTPMLRVFNTIVTQPMPQWSEDNVWAFLELAGTLLYPLGLTLQIPLYMYILTLEKSEKLREMMLSHGLKTRYYHIVNYLFFYVIYAFAAALFWLFGLALRSRFFMSTHWSVLLLFFFGWGFALVSLASFVSAFLNSPRVATVAGYIIALFGTNLAFIVCVGIYGFTPFSLKTTYPFWTFIWPQFSFMRGMYLLNDACALQGQCYGPITTLKWSDEFSKALLAIYLAGIIYYILFLYLDAVLPREYGIPKHPLFFLPCFGAKSKKFGKKSSQRAPLEGLSSSNGSVSRYREAPNTISSNAGNYSPDGGTESARSTFNDSDSNVAPGPRSTLSGLEHGDSDPQSIQSHTQEQNRLSSSLMSPTKSNFLGPKPPRARAKAGGSNRAYDYDSDYGSEIDDTEAVVAPLSASTKLLAQSALETSKVSSENGSYGDNQTDGDVFGLVNGASMATGGEQFLFSHENALDDVELEAARVINGSYAKNSPLVCHALRKVYSSGKVAVKGLYLAVAENECFGLLGENGAGKSTTLSILTGMFKPTDGTALVGGYDIRTEIDQVHLSMGLCPQFDILWNDLTVREHLLFYARLKGIDSSEEDEHVDRLIAEVGLSKSKNKRADALSGGMRRRLSIAVSLVGDSRIVFLDEPTTGLDAASRRQIWAIIRRAKRGRAIILTTHSMDEAELLCSKIGILAHGKLRCIGNQQHLKSLFGEGVRLKLNYGQSKSTSARIATIQNESSTKDHGMEIERDSKQSSISGANGDASQALSDAEARDRVMKFIAQQFPTASVAGDFHGTIEFLLGPSTPISHIFRTMETQAPKELIHDWAVSQIGLEDVFQTVVAQAEFEKDSDRDSYDSLNSAV